ncbi:hypothetical protein BX666DRAFT_1996417 [Dichotomocladium elegans]|nr:hypothetical protein BX666DRAFT_1996417 [Dichotomocladium elegans]
MSKRPRLRSQLLLDFIVFFWAFLPFTVDADPSAATNTECQQVQTFLLGSSMVASDCCNVTAPGQYFYAGCNSQGQVMTLRYDGQIAGQVCDGATAGALQALTALENLTLDYYLDQSRCPAFFTSQFFQNFTHLRALTLRGSRLSAEPVGNITNVTAPNSVEYLDLSYSSVEYLQEPESGPPGWLVALFSQLKSLTFLVHESPMMAAATARNFDCAPLANLTLDVMASTSSSPGIIQWIATNCTRLTYLDLHVHADPSSAQDISAWLEPLGTGLPSLVGLTINLVEGSALSTFPSWISHMTHMTALSYHANVHDQLHEDVLSQLPLTMLDMRGNGLFGDLPATLSSTQLVNIDLSGNQLSGDIPEAFSNTTSCDLRDNPILCAGIGNSWGMCDHCNLVPGFLDVMSRYMIEWIVIAVCLLIVLCGWVYVAFKRHQQTSFRVWLGVFFSLFSFVNLLTTIVYLGLNVRLYTTSFSLMLASTVIVLGINIWVYRYCCRRFNILIIRRTWPVFFVCALDMNNFALYEIRMLNLSAYREPIDMRISTTLSWIKVILADAPHTGISIFLLMLHAPVASILLTCITSGIAMMRGIIQIFIFCWRARREQKLRPVSVERKRIIASIAHSEVDTISHHSVAVSPTTASLSTAFGSDHQGHHSDAELAHLIDSKATL